jgi:hypothetical protein
MYRGISLLSSAEKLLSLVILQRIKRHLEARLQHQQAGFRAGKSCRSASFVLMRRLERAIRTGDPRVFNFVDFSKAFDSLDWDTMWRVLRVQGMPPKIVEVIQRLYHNSTISIRLSTDGSWVPAFKQEVGIRQGCSLSPALFVLVLDFAMRAFSLTCEELGLDRDAAWLGYADDLVIESSSVDGAEKVFLQLQAACAFVGLFANISKTECMAVGVCRPEVSAAKAQKERIEVSWGRKKRRGWLIDWVAREAIAGEAMDHISLNAFPERKPSHFLMYDDGDMSPVLLKKGGWLMGSHEDKHRCKKLGCKEFIDPSLCKHRCPDCSATFHSELAITKHQQCGVCQKRENMTTATLRRLRTSRELRERLRGQTTEKVEQVTIRVHDGCTLRCTGSFCYLGSKVTNLGGSSEEVRRRTRIAATVFSSLWRIWDSSVLSTRLKLHLFSSLVRSILLYNGECWALTRHDLNLLEKFHFRCLKRLTGRARGFSPQQDAVDKASYKDVYRTAQVSCIEAILREKRMRWLGHLIRSPDEDLSRQCLFTEARSSSRWWKLVQTDLFSARMSFKNAIVRAKRRRDWHKLSKQTRLDFVFVTATR